MKIEKVKSISDNLSTYDMYVNKDSDNDYIELTRWQNGDGYVISFNDKTISLSDGEIDAIVHLRNALLYDTTSKLK